VREGDLEMGKRRGRNEERKGRKEILPVNT
jgi:hypothetical protein